MRKYKKSTLKKLFAVCGNECAFNGCDKPIVDPATKAVLGQICHIRSGVPNGPRFDPLYPPALFDDQSNLVLMCVEHHREIDQDTKTFTPGYLSDLKHAHERKGGKAPELSDEQIAYFQAQHEYLVYKTRPIINLRGVAEKHWVGDAEPFLTVELCNVGETRAILKKCFLTFSDGSVAEQQQTRAYTLSGFQAIEAGEIGDITLKPSSAVQAALRGDIPEGWSFQGYLIDPNDSARDCKCEEATPFWLPPYEVHTVTNYEGRKIPFLLTVQFESMFAYGYCNSYALWAEFGIDYAKGNR